MFNIKNISNELLDPENLEALESEGITLVLDTRNILENIELE
jgi:hypothetical protein